MTERPFSLTEDLALLEATINRLSAILVIIDPLQTALGPARARSSSHPSSAHPRALLSSLAQLAQRTGCAFLLTRSVKIRRSELRHPRPTGSPDLVSAARSCLLIASDPDDDRTRLLLSTKSPLCHKPDALAYEVVEAATGVPAIRWLEDGEDVLTSLLEEGPSRSAQRQDILEFANTWDAPIGPRELSSFIGYDYERVRKMMQRMLEDGELVLLSRGLYTTPSHPCLVDVSTATEDASTYTNAPNVAHAPDQATGPNPPPPVAHRESEIIHVSNVPTEAPLLKNGLDPEKWRT